MLLPVSYSETFVLNKEKYHVSAQTLVHSILEGLRKKQVSEVKNVANSIYFKSGFGLLNLWGILLPVSSGSILVKEQKAEIYVTYKLKFHNFIIYPTLLASILLSVILMTQMSCEIIKVAKSLLFAWLSLFGGSCLLTIFSFPMFVKRTLN